MPVLSAPSPTDGSGLVTFAAAKPHPIASLVPPPAPPYRRLAVADVFAPGTTKRFGRNAGPASVSATLRRTIAIARLIARPNQSTALAARVAERVGIKLPPPGRRVTVGHLAFTATGPGEWLATAEGENGVLFSQQLIADLGTFAEVRDATSEIAVLDIVGERSRDLLSKGLELDTDPRVFPIGHCGSAELGRGLVTIGCLSSGTAYQLALSTSDLPDFANWLATSGTEFGLETIS